MNYLNVLGPVYFLECNTTETKETATTSSKPASSTSSKDLRTTTVLMGSSGTDQAYGPTNKYKKRHEDTKDVLQSDVIGLSVAVTVIAILILLVTGYMVKRKLFSK